MSMADFYLNIIHRPEMVPEYIQKEAEHLNAQFCEKYLDRMKRITEF